MRVNSKVEGHFEGQGRRSRAKEDEEDRRSTGRLRVIGTVEGQEKGRCSSPKLRVISKGEGFTREMRNYEAKLRILSEV